MSIYRQLILYYDIGKNLISFDRLDRAPPTLVKLLLQMSFANKCCDEEL